MTSRPSRTVIYAQIAALAAAVAVAALAEPAADWDLMLLGVLLVTAIVSDLISIALPVHRTVVSASFLTIIIASVFLGGVPAAVIGVLTIVVSWARERYTAPHLLINLVTYAWFPLLAGIAFHALVDAGMVETGSPVFYLLIFGTFLFALAIDFGLIAGYSCYVERSSFATKIRRALLPLLPSELASAVLALGVAFAYVEAGTEAVALLGVLVLVFQYLVGALLVSQERAEELEVRARQLAGFQVALLSALLRTLDLRDRMTARHSAAVARYSREIAAQAGLGPEDQELVHSAALLHDIGKFVLPDTILKSGRRKLTEAEWEEIKKHPAEGARIVSQIDGYEPIGEIILAHHEHIDGRGYPRGLAGEEIPELARVIAVADTYDVMTARDTYREPASSYEAVTELRRVAGSQLDARFVEAFVEVLDGKDLAYRHGEDADFEAELALDKRIHDYVAATPHVPDGTPLAPS
jgi:putative nucleotidyltransferase with HDIG domain